MLDFGWGGGVLSLWATDSPVYKGRAGMIMCANETKE